MNKKRFIAGGVLLSLVVVGTIAFLLSVNGRRVRAIDPIEHAGEGLLSRYEDAMAIYYKGEPVKAERALVNFITSNSVLPEIPMLQIYRCDFESSTNFRLQLIRAYLYSSEIDFKSVRSLRVKGMQIAGKSYDERGYQGLLKSLLFAVEENDTVLCPWANPSIILQARQAIGN